jgi:heme/copper-type cytochrome/quinol oxidase subunit 2
MLSVAALISAIVWLVVVVLFVMAWVDDRRREDDEILRQSKLGGWNQRSPAPAVAGPTEPVAGPAAEDRSLV